MSIGNMRTWHECQYGYVKMDDVLSPVRVPFVDPTKERPKMVL